MAAARMVWVGQIEGIFGYGIVVIGETEAECMKAMKAKFQEWNRQLPTGKTFAAAYKYWAGTCLQVELGKAYSDGFR